MEDCERMERRGRMKGNKGSDGRVKEEQRKESRKVKDSERIERTTRQC